MTYVKPTDPILYTGNGPKFTMLASGNIDAGQFLTSIGTMKAIIAGAVDNAVIGVAQYDADHGNNVTVLGKGNVVRCIVEGSSVCAVGDDMMTVGTEGKVSNAGLDVGLKIGVALETQATDDGTVRLLLV